MVKVIINFYSVDQKKGVFVKNPSKISSLTKSC